jgi:hypothetical protein
MRLRLLLSLCVLPIALLGWCASARVQDEYEIEKQPKGGKPPDVLVLFHKGDPQFSPEATMRFGLVLPKLQPKRLTYHPQGLTNNTCLKIDSKEILLGTGPGQWQEREGKLPPGRFGVRSVRVYPAEKVHVTQIVEIIRGTQTGNVDTCRVEYILENKDQAEHSLGLRFLLDTFIGMNDGAPFVVPGEKALIETDKDFDKAEAVPAFAQAMEKLDFTSPGVVAHLNLKAGGGLEPPGRVTFGGWPDDRSNMPGAAGPNTKWSVPVFSMKVNRPTDSAAVLYWAEKKLAPGAKRTLGFTYGLGNFASDKEGKLGLILAGPFQVGGDMTILALVKDPQADQTVSLKLPKELELAKGEETQKVPMPPPGSSSISPVTWTVRTPQDGVVAFTVATSTGASLRQGVRINKKVETGQK